MQLSDEQINRFATTIADEQFIFQQDTATVHTAKCITDYLKSNSIRILDWPACSPDKFNIIENCWATIGQNCVRYGKQFQTVKELKECIMRNWSTISRKYNM